MDRTAGKTKGAGPEVAVPKNEKHLQFERRRAPCELIVALLGH